MDAKIDLSEVIANGEAYRLEAPLPHYESLARKVQVLLGDKVTLKPRYDSEEGHYWLTDRISLESVLLSEHDHEVYIYSNKMYVAEHSSGDDPTIGYCYYGTLYPSIAVLADGIEVGRTTDPATVVTMAVDAIVCCIAKPVPKPKKPVQGNPSLN